MSVTFYCEQACLHYLVSNVLPISHMTPTPAGVWRDQEASSGSGHITVGIQNESQANYGSNLVGASF